MSENISKSDRPNLYLVGFMGTGKTTLGRRVAQFLGYGFLDSDVEIEKKVGMKIPEIFEKFGEPYFRNLEREFIETGHPDSGNVVSCGGGLVCRDSMPELVRKKGVCIALFSTPEEIFARVSGGKQRPLLNVENPLERIKTLSEGRTPFYLRSGIAIAASKDLSETEAHIIRVYHEELKRRKSDKFRKNLKA